jgi:hypothetical protein
LTVQAEKAPIPANQRSISAIGIKPLSCVFSQSDRREEAPTPADATSEPRHSRDGSNTPDREERRQEMKKFGFATIAASGLAAAILGLAAPVQAATGVEAPTVLASAIEIPTGIDHHQWVHDIQPKVNVPQVDTTVRVRGSH